MTYVYHRIVAYSSNKSILHWCTKQVPKHTRILFGGKINILVCVCVCVCDSPHNRDKINHNKWTPEAGKLHVDVFPLFF